MQFIYCKLFLHPWDSTTITSDIYFYDTKCESALRCGVIYLHQLREEVHGYTCAFVEEHWDTSQEAWKDTEESEKGQLWTEQKSQTIALQDFSYQLSVHEVHHRCYAASATSSSFPKKIRQNILMSPWEWTENMKAKKHAIYIKVKEIKEHRVHTPYKCWQKSLERPPAESSLCCRRQKAAEKVWRTSAWMPRVLWDNTG